MSMGETEGDEAKKGTRSHRAGKAVGKTQGLNFRLRKKWSHAG